MLQCSNSESGISIDFPEFCGVCHAVQDWNGVRKPPSPGTERSREIGGFARGVNDSFPAIGRNRVLPISSGPRDLVIRCQTSDRSGWGGVFMKVGGCGGNGCGNKGKLRRKRATKGKAHGVR